METEAYTQTDGQMQDRYISKHEQGDCLIETIPAFISIHAKKKKHGIKMEKYFAKR